MTLSPVEQRVLGALIEKEITTPENYPLSLNSLQAAANQRSSRDPVMDLSEGDVRSALHALEQLGLVTTARDGRVPKWEHLARTVLNLRRDETAVLCLLLLRGPQTPGEIRARADRLYSFTDLESVLNTLDRLAARAGDPADPGKPSGPLTAILPRAPGAREARFRHLLGEATDPAADRAEDLPAADRPAADHQQPTSTGRSISPATLAALEQRLLALEDRVARLEQARATAPVVEEG